MNKIILSSIIILSFSFLSLYSQTERYAFPENTSLEKAKDIMEKELVQLDFLISMNGLFQGSASDSLPDDLEAGMTMDEAKPSLKMVSKAHIDDTLSIYFNQLYFKQLIGVPSSIIKPNTDMYWLNEAVGLDDGGTNGNDPKFAIRKVYYADGSTEEMESTSLEIRSMKFVDSMQVDVSWHYPTDFISMIISSANPELELGGGKFKFLQSLNPKEITVLYEGLSMDESFKKISKVVGIRENGKALRYNSYSYYPSNGYIDKMYAALEALYKDLIEGIDANKFGDANQVADSINTVMLPIVESAEDGGTNLAYSFEHSVDNLCFFVPKAEIFTSTAMLRNEGVNRTEYQAFQVAEDRENKKYGIVDLSGNWVVSPTYAYMDYHTNSYYYAKIKDIDEEQSYELKENGELKPLGYLILSYNESRNFIHFKSLDNKQGISDLEGNYILNPLYDEIECQYNESLFVTTTNVDSLTCYKELFDLVGNKVLPGKYFEIEIEYWGNNLTALSKEGNVIREVVYNAEEKTITKERDIPESEYTGSRLLDLKYNFESDTYDYVAYSGAVAIKGNQEYRFDDYEFRGPRAIVTKENEEDETKYGFIDIEGNLMVPIEYDKVEPFVGRYTYVEKAGQPLLIDQNGAVYKELPGKLYVKQNSWYSSKQDKSIDEVVFELENGESYTVSGKLVVR